MGSKKIIQRELEVAFSKHSQPVWFRILKYILLGIVVFFFWGTQLLWIVLSVLLVLSLLFPFHFSETFLIVSFCSCCNFDKRPCILVTASSGGRLCGIAISSFAIILLMYDLNPAIRSKLLTLFTIYLSKIFQPLYQIV